MLAVRKLFFLKPILVGVLLYCRLANVVTNVEYHQTLVQVATALIKGAARRVEPLPLQQEAGIHPAAKWVRGG